LRIVEASDKLFFTSTRHWHEFDGIAITAFGEVGIRGFMAYILRSKSTSRRLDHTRPRTTTVNSAIVVQIANFYLPLLKQRLKK
jgi:hypothetical protein